MKIVDYRPGRAFRQTVTNPTTLHMAYVDQIDTNNVAFYELVPEQNFPVLRCICTNEEMIDRLRMWNFE